MAVSILVGDCRDVLRTLPEKSVHCAVTSPPYFGLRDYGVEGQIGLEQTPAQYVTELVAVFREVRRVLRDAGLVADRLGRDAILIELNPEYAELAENRIRSEQPLFANVLREAAE